jgi:hypothetical protein
LACLLLQRLIDELRGYDLQCAGLDALLGILSVDGAILLPTIDRRFVYLTLCISLPDGFRLALSLEDVDHDIGRKLAGDFPHFYGGRYDIAQLD